MNATSTPSKPSSKASTARSPLRIEIVTSHDTPRIRFTSDKRPSKFFELGLVFAPPRTENDFSIKAAVVQNVFHRNILHENPVDVPDGSESHNRVHKIHREYARLLGPKFNLRLRKLQTRFLLENFHPRVVRMIYRPDNLAGIRMRRDVFSFCWHERQRLNEIAVTHPNILPFVISTTTLPENMMNIIGANTWFVIRHSSARRNEDIARLYRRNPDLLHFYICQPSQKLRFGTHALLSTL